MSGPVPGAPTLAERVADAYGDLTPQEQRVADLIRARRDDLVLYNSSELARLSGVSKATVSRLYRRLGFANSAEVRDLLRAQRSTGSPVALDDARNLSLRDQFERDVANLRRMHTGLDQAVLTALADRILSARQVLVLGYRNAFPVALHLRQQLAQARDGVRLGPEPGQSLGEEITGLDDRDVVLLVGFRRRPERFPRLVTALAGTGAHRVLIADPTAARYADAFDVVLECPIESASAFDSYAAPMSLASLLAGLVLARAGARGSARVRAIDDGYARLAELDTP